MKTGPQLNAISINCSILWIASVTLASLLPLCICSKGSAAQFTNAQGVTVPSTLQPIRPMPIAPPPEQRPNLASTDMSPGGAQAATIGNQPANAAASDQAPVPTATATPTEPPTESSPISTSPPASGTPATLSNSNNTSLSSAQPPVIPSLESGDASVKGVAPKNLDNFQMPQHAGQTWVEYDIRPFTKNVKNFEKPQQWLVDWIIRETGTDVWFNEPMGVLSADKEKLRVFHTPAMQKRVAEIYEKFVNGTSEPQIYGVRMITINNPNWRSRALPLMRSVPSTSPGVSAWLMPKENGAILLSQLRARNDAREMQAYEIPLYNGQLQYMEQMRPRNYLKEYLINTSAPYPPYIPNSSVIQEGFKLQISPLMSLDGKVTDLMLKCEIDQVERLNPVKIELPVNGNQLQSVQIEVPQIVSWRLQERFQWPTDQVLLLSCGVVANPVGEVNNTLLNNPPNFLGLNKVIPTVGQRNDALLWIEYKGTASNHLGLQNTVLNPTAPSPQSTTPNSFGTPVQSSPTAGNMNAATGGLSPASGVPNAPTPTANSISRGRY